MIITAASVTALMTGYRKDYQSGISSAAPQYLEVATVVPSSTKSNTYGWLGQFPKFREWIGDRVIKNMAAHGYTITNKHWESSVGVNRDDIEDDNIGVYSPLFQEMGRASTVQPDELVFPLLKDGFNQLCYDGQNFFDTDHPVNAEVDGSGADVSVSNVMIDGAYTGEPWFLLDTSRAVKPVIFQERKKPILTSMTKLDDEAVFTQNEFRFGVDMRNNAGFSFWQMAFGAQADLTYDNLWLAYLSMRGFTADGGRPLGIKPVTLTVTTQDEKAATELVMNKTRANGEDNALYKKFKVVVADYM
jgi:phage major head subunit gpT-like protein